MQLILDTEPSTEINVIMTTLEESLATNLKNSIDTCKNEISNGNKENVESQQNIVDAGNGEHLKPHSDDSTEISVANIKLNNEINVERENLANKTEDVIRRQSCENGDNLHNNYITNGDEMECDGIISADKDKIQNILEITAHNESQDTILNHENNINMATECVGLVEADESDTVNNQIKVEEVDPANNELSSSHYDIKLDINDQKEDDLNDLDSKMSKSTEDNTVEDDLNLENKQKDSYLNDQDSKMSKSTVDNKVKDDSNLEDFAGGEENMASNSIVKALELLESEAKKSPISADISEGSKEAKKTENLLANLVVENQSEITEEVQEETKDTLKTVNSDQFDKEVYDGTDKMDDYQFEKAVDDHVGKVRQDLLKQVAEVKNNKAADNYVENQAGDQLNLVAEGESEEVVNEHFKNELNDQPKQDIKDEKENVMDNHVEKKDEVVVHKLEKITVSELDTVAEEATLVNSELAKSNNSEEQKEADGDLNQKACDELEKGTVEGKDSVLSNNNVVPKNKSFDDSIECDVSGEGDLVKNTTSCNKGKIFDVDVAEEIVEQAIDTTKEVEIEATETIKEVEVKTSFCKLSNTLDILSDDDDNDLSPADKDQDAVNATDKQCINIEDDDDIMLIDEDTDIKDSSEPAQKMETEEKKEEPVDECTIDLEESPENTECKEDNKSLPEVQKDLGESDIDKSTAQETFEKTNEIKETTVFEKKEENNKPLVAENLLKGCKKNLADMTRDELEEFCLLKIVEGIVDRSNLSEIKTKLKTMTQNIDEFKKKALMLTKQNRDLQLVLKSVQEEQKKKSETAIIPLKITRSVGMQVLMTEKPGMRKKAMPTVPATASSNVNTRAMNNRNQNTSPRQPKPAPNTQLIPVPRLVPAMTNPAVKAPNATPQVSAPSNSVKTSNQAMNGMKVQTPQKAEKRPHNRVQSVTVDLTDDEPPTKVTPRSSPAPPVRLVSPQNLLQRPPFTQSVNTPRKVYIPISGPQSQNIRPGQTIMLKSVGPPPGAPGQRIRGPAPRMPQNAVRMTRVQGTTRHPAPLPECLKQYQPPNWKALPPAPDLKLSKVENGIVISWKIEGYQEDSYEEIASYQLYAYQETSSPPSTALWKKIGDVKALPLPMACTLTQFMAGFKYYFAVRAVDVRSRLGPFSLPGSILLLNKM